MSESTVLLPRRIVPRWRDFETTAQLGELGGIRAKIDPLEHESDFESVIRNWRQLRTNATAGDLLAAAAADNRPELVVEAAEFLLRKQSDAPSLTKAVAKSLLESILDDPSKKEVSHPSHFNPTFISRIRKSLRAYPRNALGWVDLALAFTTIGKNLDAERAIVVALSLAPDDRFVLRSAARFFVHIGDVKRALSILSRAPRTPFDSWLLAAQLAVSSILDRPSNFHKQAKVLCASDNIQPFHKSELGAALGTVEVFSGSDKQARRFFEKSLTDPTENALAQALWAKNHLTLTQAPNLVNVSRSYEANARTLMQVGNWKQAFAASESWLEDEPFSGRPAALGSFIATTVLRDEELAIRILTRALPANPFDPVIVNNLAFSYASSGKVELAHKFLSRLTVSELDIANKIMLTATEGLIEFREGHTAEGRLKYGEAIDLAIENDLPRSRAVAMIYLAREEDRIASVEAEATRAEAVRLAKQFTDVTFQMAFSLLPDAKIVIEPPSATLM